ncbi:ABC transporter permease [Piscinibacterium candidicorallinum]|uniref:ABC transporter permease n=1 Tax=Piscinibacterium candidicorallinum TaxID=1793872 RepID=A0ABV7GXY7_9BURK
MSLSKFFSSVLRKELIDSLRDRRTIMTVLTVSILSGPLSLFLMGEFIGSIERDAERREVYVAGADQMPGLINFMQRQGLTIKEPPADYEAKIRSGDFQRAVVRPGPKFAEKLTHGEKAPIEVVFESTRTSAGPSISIATEAVRGYNREVGSQRLIALGMSPGVMQAVDLERIDMATAQARGAQILFIVPWVALLACIGGMLSVAIDVTAGERERGSLEPLLTTPGERSAIVAGKWLTVTLYGCAVILLTVVGMWVSTQLIRSEALASIMQLSTPQVLMLIGILIPFAGFIAAGLMLVSTFGRSFKEAQTYASYFMLIFNFLPITSLFIKQKDQLWQLFVPGLAQQFTMERVVRGEALGALDIALPALVALAAAVIFMALQKNLLARERIIFGRS